MILASAKLFFRPPDRERGPAVLHPEEAEPVDCIAWKLTATTPSWRFKDKARPAAKPVVQRAVTASGLSQALRRRCCQLLSAACPIPRLATELRLFLSPPIYSNEPTLFLPSSLHPALFALPLIQHHTIFYTFSLVNSLLMQSGTFHGA